MLRKVVGRWAGPLRGIGVRPFGGRRFGGGCRDVPETETSFAARTVISFGCGASKGDEGPCANARTGCDTGARTGTSREASPRAKAGTGCDASSCR